MGLRTWIHNWLQYGNDKARYDNLGISQNEIETYIEEFDSKLGDKYDTQKSEILQTVGEGHGMISDESAPLYYAIIRATQPNLVVETGVAQGLSTWIILEALAENDNGELISIDYPRYAGTDIENFLEEKSTGSDFSEPNKVVAPELPPEKKPGWIVPDELRDNWTLFLGLSQRVLPRIADTVEGMDIFIHDSEHTETCMLFEYDFAWHWMADDGIILSDDISLSNAGDIFVQDRDAVLEQLTDELGVLTK